MSPARRLLALAAPALLLLGLAGCAGGPEPVPADPAYPRLDTAALSAHGYPDPHHAYFRPGWTPRLDADGEPFGYGTLCRGLVWLERPDVTAQPGRFELPPFTLLFHPDYAFCDISPFLAFCEAALLDLGELWGLEPRGALALRNPDNTEAYVATTGQGTWRTFRLEGDAAVVQPVPVLLSRTLAPHTAYDLVGRWLLESNTGDRLPLWLLDGLCSYGADLGVHLNNYMNQFRPAGPVLLHPGEADRLLAAGVLPDPDLDREMFRKARYSSFVAVWRLVEEHGGPGRVRAFLRAVADGADPDAASLAAWGLDLAALAADVDPVLRGEPLGTELQSRNPQLNPGPRGLPHRHHGETP